MIYTFGYGHEVNGIPLRQAFYRIPLDSDAARERMFAMFGNSWGFEYDTEADAGVAEYGLRELVFPHPEDEFIGPRRQLDPHDVCLCGGRRDHHGAGAMGKGKANVNPNRVLKNRDMVPCLHCPCPEFIRYDAPAFITKEGGK